MARMDPFTSAYFEAALWSTNDESDESGGEPLDKNYSESDIDEATTAKMIADCADFQERFGELINDDDSPDIQRFGASELAGYDFWMTRNGHGVGFWEDSDWPKHGKELDAGAKEFGEFYLEVGGDGEIYGSPLDSPRKKARESRGVVRASHRVADFNTLGNLVNHAHRELGATHVSGEDAHTKLYFPRGGQHSYEEATVWRKGGYWHAQGPGARTGIAALPQGAKAIGKAGQRAAEARGVVQASRTPRGRFAGKRTPAPNLGDVGAVYEFNVKLGRVEADISDREWEDELSMAQEELRTGLKNKYPWIGETHMAGRSGGWLAVEDPTGKMTKKRLEEMAKYVEAARQRFVSDIEQTHPRGSVARTSIVRDYAVVDRQDRTVAGPFKNYSDARSAAGGAGAVKFVPSKTRTTSEARRSSHHKIGLRKPRRS